MPGVQWHGQNTCRHDGFGEYGRFLQSLRGQKDHKHSNRKTAKGLIFKQFGTVLTQYCKNPPK